ncbi:monofunctional biosynthetic peptidoglycan transglycosylase [Emticicia sp. CRIBPO]|uniref:monofunctional biosynthetic peptidoglycan transglycosylase n=1 Tax=Emticicia sp. CRIBPO TaxID=2683258 RepID=UPI00141241C9|nr:monofunctional biosynthetic peptidoglycan transglycosylase [Emticicia sp. CRIBPO]NBA85111.1 monofunctional biosynthetic peptidoglycan transglycosylase [Emticicia sp. CRIBPO]
MAKLNTVRKPKPKNKKKQSGFSGIIGFLKKVILYFVILSVGSVVLFKFVPIPITITMIDQKIGALIDGKSSEIYYDWESYSDISKEVPLAAVAAEDQLFPEHLGFDFKSMRNAFKNNSKGKKVRGASTISQQVAKNVFLWQERSYVRKAFEVYFTFLIEVIWGKKRILEVYINVAEMGPMTFGAEAAAQKYFRKSAASLTRNEAARLAAVLPSPRKWSASRPGPYVNRRTSQIARQMRALGGTSYIKNLRSF